MAKRDSKQIERTVYDAFAKITPNAPDALLSNLGPQQKGVLLEMTDSVKIPSTKTKTPLARILPKIAAAAAAVILLVGGFAAGGYVTNHKVISTATLDVNPSVEIELNRKDRVLGVNALNEDGKAIIGTMDFDGQTLEMTVNALIGSMLRGGYLSDIANSILVSVDSGDSARAEALQKQISDAVLAGIGGEGDSFSGAVLTQTIVKDDELRSLADKYGISLGKAQLIRQITAQNSFYTFEQLAALTVNELNLLSESGGLTLENVSASGSASDKAYIGEAKAKEAALAAVSAKEADITGYKCEMEYEKGVMVYEIEFDCGGSEYEIDVNALTGEIVKFDEEASEHYQPQPNTDKSSGDAPAPTPDPTPAPTPDPTPAPTPDPTPESDIGEAKAKEIALTHAGVSESEVTNYKCKTDRENGALVYEIEFDARGLEYDYEIGAADGKILKSEKETADHGGNGGGNTTGGNTGGNTTGGNTTGGNTTGGNTTGGNTTPSYIGEAKAKEIVLSHAGVSAADASRYQCKLDVENGITVYEIEFDAGRFEYDYDVNALTGKILHADKEWADPVPGTTGGNTTGGNSAGGNTTGGNTTGGNTTGGNSGNTTGGNTTPSYIGEAKAKEIALSHAGVKAADAWNMECKLDRENGIVVYEISFDAGNYEYEYDVNATNGSVLKSDREYDDDAKGGNTTGGNTAGGSTAGGSTYIGDAKAKEIALAHAGVSAADAKKMECEMEKEHGVALYEISFKAGGYEYEYDVNALTGDILKFDRERDD